MGNPYGIGEKPSIRERFADRLSRFTDRAKREAPGIAKRGARRAVKGFAKAGTNFARNASFNINSNQQQKHWDSLNDALIGGRGSQADAVSNLILGTGSGSRGGGNLNLKPPRAQNIHIHVHSGAPRRSKRRGQRDPFSPV